MLPVFVDSDLFTYVREVPKEGPLSVEQRSTISLIIEKIYKQHQASELFDGLTKLVDDLFTKLTSRKGDELELQAVKLANAFKSTTLFNLPPELVSSILTFLAAQRCLLLSLGMPLHKKGDRQRPAAPIPSERL